MKRLIAVTLLKLGEVQTGLAAMGVTFYAKTSVPVPDAPGDALYTIEHPDLPEGTEPMTLVRFGASKVGGGLVSQQWLATLSEAQAFAAAASAPGVAAPSISEQRNDQ